MLDENKTSDTINVPNTIECLIEQAFKELILRRDPSKDSNGTNLHPIAAILSDTKILFIEVNWTDDSTKEKYLRVLGETCLNQGCHRVILINDVVYKTYDQKPDRITDRPLFYPPEMREEALILSYLDFKDYKKNFFRVHPYKFVGGTLTKEAALDFSHENIMAMDSFMLSNVAHGFLKAAMLDVFKRKELVSQPMSLEIGDMVLKEVLAEYPGATLGKDLLGARDDAEALPEDDLDIEDHPLNS